MAKPIIFNISAMPADKDNIITFAYSGGLIKKTILQVLSVGTNTVLYTHEWTTAKSEHKIPANYINISKYGMQFYLKIKVIENDGSESLWSDSKLAIFISEPNFNFKNINSSINISRSYLDVQLNYSQNEGELLKEFGFYLFNSDRIQISSSGLKYNTNDLNYRYSNLEDGVYYIQAKGSTVNGYQVETPIIEVRVKYTVPEIFASFFVTNNSKDGYIKYESNIISVDYHGDEVFDYNDGHINLMDKSLYYDRGFIIPNDGTFVVKGKHLYSSGTRFFEVNNSDKISTFYVTGYIYDDDKIRYKLVANNGLENYILYSPAVKITNDDEVTFWIRKKDGLFLFKLYVNGMEVT